MHSDPPLGPEDIATLLLEAVPPRVLIPSIRAGYSTPKNLESLAARKRAMRCLFSLSFVELLRVVLNEERAGDVGITGKITTGSFAMSASGQ